MLPPLPHASEAPAWRRRLAWPLLVALAVVVYELTMNPVLGAVIASLKFGWDHLASAHWLWRRDENRARGKATGLYYLAAAFSRVGLVSLCMVVILVLTIAPAGGVALRITAALLLELAGMLAVAAGLTLAAAAYSRARGIRVWIDPAVHSARRKKLFPPPYVRAQCGGLLVYSSLFTLLLISVIGFGLFLKAGGGRWLDGLGRGGAAIVLVGYVSGTVAGFFLLKHWMLATLATSPHECWPDGELPAGETSDSPLPAAFSAAPFRKSPSASAFP